MHNPLPPDSAAAKLADADQTSTAPATPATPATPPPVPHIELLPPSLSLRIGKRRLTLSRRPRKSLSHLLSGLLYRSWRALFGSRLRISLVTAAVCAAWNTATMAATPAANTLPTGGTITAGSATIAQTANTLTINQTSNQAIGNFTSFSIGSGASVIINEPSSASSFLARVTGTDPSQIYGLLQSNGGVMLINQNGILVGQGGVVDVARFVASTINISDSDFLAGKLTFSNTAGTSGTVENQGLIQSASGGSVYLIGSNVSNSGVIHSPNGEVILAAGATVQLVDTGTPGVTVNITGAAGNITNLGNITAEAGTIGIAAGLINNSGTVNASSVVADGGRIFLRASNSLTTTDTSTIAANGADSGGSVVLYSAGSAFIDGNVSATGAAGKGGYVETSGLTSLDVVSAPTIGAGGTWYIDPYDLTVVSDSNNNSSIAGTGPFVVTSTGTGSTIKASCISAWLSEDLNVTLATTGDASVGGSGNITVNAAITKSAGSYASLTLDADGNIYINANITSTSGLLDLNLWSNYQSMSGAIGSVQLNGATIALNGGALNVSDGIAGFQNGNLLITNGGVLNLSYNTSDPNAQQGGSVYAGNLSVDATSSVIGLADSGTTLWTSGTYTNDGTLSLANAAIVNISNFVNDSTGSVTLNNVTVCTTDVSNAGTLALTNSTLNADETVVNSGTLNLTKSTLLTGAGFTNETIVSTSGTVTSTVVGTVNVNYLSTFTGPVTNEGVMTLDSTGGKPNGYTGDNTITLNSGITNTGRLVVLGNVTNNGNLINTGGNISIGSSSEATTLNISGYLNNSGNIALSGGSGSMLTGVTFAYNDTINNNGNLTLGSGSTLLAAGGALNNDGTIVMTAANISLATFYNNAGGTLSGTGTITVAAGEGGSSYLFNDGVIAPGGVGTVGTLNVTGNFSQSSTGTLLLDVASDTNYDNLSVTGAIGLDGTLQTTLLGTYVPALNQAFQPFGGNANVSGSFRHVLGDVITNSSGGLEMIKALNVGSTDGTFYMVMCGSADISFSGNGGSSWSNISNWSTGYFPTAIDNVTVSGGSLEHTSADGTDTVNSLNVTASGFLSQSGGTLVATNLTSAGTVAISGGSLQVGNLTSTGSFSLGYIEGEGTATLALSGNATWNSLYLERGGTITGVSGSVLNVTGNFEQYACSSMSSGGTVIINQTSGDLTVGNITAANLTLASGTGAIDQSDALHVTRQLVTTSVAGTTLDNSDNQIAAYSGVNTGSGDIVLVNNLNTTDTAAVALTGISNTGGNISVDNTGAMTTNGSISATATGSNVSLSTHSPLTIDAAVSANGNISLSAGDGSSNTDNLTINAAVTSTNGGNITLFAGNNLAINASISTTSPGVVSLTAENGVVSYGSTTTTTTSSAGSNTSSSNSFYSLLSNTSSGTDNTGNTTNVSTPSNTSTSTTFTTSTGETMTTGGESGTFGGDDSEGNNSNSSGSPTKSSKTIKLYCS